MGIGQFRKKPSRLTWQQSSKMSRAVAKRNLSDSSSYSGRTKQTRFTCNQKYENQIPGIKNFQQQGYYSLQKNHSKELTELPSLEINANSEVHHCEEWWMCSCSASAWRREDREEVFERPIQPTLSCSCVDTEREFQQNSCNVIP